MSQPAGEKPAAAIGIDLGTTYSAMAIVDLHGRPHTIRNREGELTLPSVVYIEPDGILVGREAVRAGMLEPALMVENAKRKIGVAGAGFSVAGRTYMPEEISGMVLRKLRQDAAIALGTNVDAAVITVPAYFGHNRRQATLDAAKIAGLEVLDIINEPLAAALAYGAASEAGEQTVMVYDLGGGTFDVSVIRIGKNEIHVLVTDGDVQLGGRDFDDRLVGYVARQFAKKHGVDPREDPDSVVELTERCEQAKRSLSVRRRTQVLVTAGGKRERIPITRDEFVGLCADLITRTQITTELAMEQAGLSWAELDHLLLSGGATRMPVIRQMLGRLWGKDPDDQLAVDEVVAWGASIHAATLRESAKFIFETKTNVNAHCLGLLVHEKISGKPYIAKMIEKNTPLPTEATRTFGTVNPGQREVKIMVCEGEGADLDGWVKIGQCLISELPEGLAARTPIKITYRYNAAGLIEVDALIERTGTAATARIVQTSRLTRERIENAAKDMSLVDLDE